jgi:hypothetical protein
MNTRPILLKFQYSENYTPSNTEWKNFGLQCSSISEKASLQPFPIQFFCQPHTPQLLFVLGGKEVGGLLVNILQF